MLDGFGDSLNPSLCKCDVLEAFGHLASEVYFLVAAFVEPRHRLPEDVAEILVLIWPVIVVHE